MLYSSQINKNTTEDPKTLVVFGDLMLLPDLVLWNILKRAAANKGILPEDAGLMADKVFFWPKWDPNSKYDTGNSKYVEPDVFFRFDNIDVIVEAKYSDSQGQYREEWEREFKAYLNEFEDDKTSAVLLAVGGNPTFEREPAIKVGNRKCPIVKYSWVSLLNAVLAFEKNELSIIQDEKQSSMKRLIRKIESDFQDIGIHKYNKKVELKGLSNLYILGEVFRTAINRETDLYSLSYFREYMNREHYGYHFAVTPKDGRRKPIWLSIALWFNEQEVISIVARNVKNDWGWHLCKQIKEGKKFYSKYAKQPLEECVDYDGYSFDAKDKFYQDFNEAETFDAQVDLVSKLIDDVCLYYLK